MMVSTNLKVAITHLTSRPKQTLVAILSVTFGISMYIFMNSFLTGVNDIQTEIAFSALAHIHIYNDLPEDNSNLIQQVAHENQLVHLRNPKVIQYTEGIKHAEKVLRVLKQQDEIEVITPQVNLNVFYRNGATKINGLLSGVDIKNEDQLFKISENIIVGDWYNLTYRKDGIFVGSGLAKNLGLHVGNNLTVSTADGISRNYEILGLFETTIGSIDNTKAYVRINTARQLISKNHDYVTDIQANIKDYNQATFLAKLLSRVIPYKVESWSQSNGQLESSNILRNIMAIATSVTILIVAGFGIYNIMNMTVNEKIREIAILKAMGFSGGDIIQIFLTQSIFIGLLGGLIGQLFGYIIAYIVDHTPFDIVILDTLPMAYRVQDYALGLLFGLITTFIAGYLPSKKASSIDPVKIIRG